MKCNRKSKIVYWSFVLLLAGVIVFLLLYQREPEDDFDTLVKDYERQIERLAGERDLLYRALTFRERKYRSTVDSLQAAIIRIQTLQTQNRTQYEIRRDSIVLMPDDELYRMVTGYIERYNNFANSGRDLESHPE